MPSKPSKAKQVAKTKIRSQAAKAKTLRNAPPTDSPPITVRLPGRTASTGSSTTSSGNAATAEPGATHEESLGITSRAYDQEAGHADLDPALDTDGWVDVAAPSATADHTAATALAEPSASASDSPPFTPRTLALMELVTDEMLSPEKPCRNDQPGNAEGDDPGDAQSPSLDGSGEASQSRSTSLHSVSDHTQISVEEPTSRPASPSPSPEERPAMTRASRKRAPPSSPSPDTTLTRGRATNRKKARVRRSPSCGVLPSRRDLAPPFDTSVEAVAGDSDVFSSPLAVVPARPNLRGISAPPATRARRDDTPARAPARVNDAVPATAVAASTLAAPRGAFAPGSLAAELLAGQHPVASASSPAMPGSTPTPLAGFPEIIGNGPHWLYENQDIAQVNEWSTFPGGKVLFAVYSRGALDYVVDPTLFHLYALVEQVVARFLGVPRVVRSPPIPVSIPSDVNQAPYGSLLHGMTEDNAAALLRLRCISTPDITLLFFPFGLQPCNVFLSLGQISFRSDEEVRAMALKTMRDRHLSDFSLLVQSSPTLRKLGDPAHVAEDILRSVTISNTPQLGKGSVPTPVFNLALDLPPVPLTEWLLWAQTLRSLAWGDGSFGTVCVRDVVHCAGCHSCEHYHWACPFRDIPNWHGSIPRTAIHWPAMEIGRPALRGRRRGLPSRS